MKVVGDVAGGVLERRQDNVKVARISLLLGSFMAFSSFGQNLLINAKKLKRYGIRKYL